MPSTPENTSTHPINDWDIAYNNSAAVADSATFMEQLAARAQGFRTELERTGESPETITYGPAKREQLDLFRPQHASVGLMIFVHGGYWMRLHRRDWSHLARGAMRRGWQVAIPGYTLCPDISIAGITRQVGAAIETAIGACEAAANGHQIPVRLVGHSAGGHLVSRMVCEDSPLSATSLRRIERVVSVSGLHDLRPLLNTEMNTTLKLDRKMSFDESPALKLPVSGACVTCWVGANELPEFIRQSGLLSNIWYGLGSVTQAVSEPGKNHFSVIDGLEHHDSPLLDSVLA